MTRVGLLSYALRGMLPPITIFERIAGLKEEMKELQAANLRYWAQSQRSPLDKTAHAFRHDRLLAIKEEFSEMMKRAR
jgi:hypothetical protein